MSERIDNGRRAHGTKPTRSSVRTNTRDLLETNDRQAARDLLLVAIVGAVLLLTSTPAWPAGSGMPWEAPLQRILESIEGPVAKVSAVVIIIITGLSLSFGDMSGGFRRLIQIVFGLSIAFAATSFFLSFFAFAGGALIGGEVAP